MKQEKIISLFLKEFSVTHALPRINEALVLTEIKFKKPILDLGCGDGRFARLLFGQRGIDVGLDPNPCEIEKADKIKAYKKTIMAPGDKTSFKDQTFKTIFSNSVLEHVTDLDGVLKETYRILKQDGLFVLTVPSPKVSQYLFWSKFIPGYARFKEKLWHHLNYFEAEEWRKRLAKAGFRIGRVRRTNSRRAIMWADIFFPLFFLGSMSWTRSFLVKQKVFGLDKDGATLVIAAKKI